MKSESFINHFLNMENLFLNHFISRPFLQFFQSSHCCLLHGSFWLFLCHVFWQNTLASKRVLSFCLFVLLSGHIYWKFDIRVFPVDPKTLHISISCINSLLASTSHMLMTLVLLGLEYVFCVDLGQLKGAVFVLGRVSFEKIFDGRITFKLVWGVCTQSCKRLYPWLV